MFDKLKMGLRHLDAWLRNTTIREDCRLVPFDSLFEERHDPVRTRVYWFVTRWSSRIWNAPGNAWDEVRFAWQRVFRGWDDRAVWSIDYWLDAKMPDMLRRLKDTSTASRRPCSPRRTASPRASGRATAPRRAWPAPRCAG